MRNRHYRYFWTELGRRTLEERTPVPRELPETMSSVLRDFRRPAGRAVLRMGTELDDRKAAHIYQRGWKILREEGFSRPLRLRPWPGVGLLIPFWRSFGKITTGVIPQSFSSRVPLRERALAMVGKTVAADKEGVELWILAGSWNDEVLEVFRSGGIRACSLDTLKEVAGQ